MGVIFAVILLLILIFIGFFGIIVGIFGVVFFKKRNNILSKISIAVIVISGLITLIPVGFFTFIFMVNALPPSDYVETDIVIEEEGYQDLMFTADGDIYVNLGLEAYEVSERMTPIFSYKTPGVLNGSQCGNYYLVENDCDFYLITDGMGNLFCKKEEVSLIYNYYTNPSNIYWYSEEDVLVSLSKEASSVMQSFYDGTINLGEVGVANEDIEIDILGLSSDYVVLIDYYWFVYDGEFIYCCYEYDSNTDAYKGYMLEGYEDSVFRAEFDLN